MKKIPTLYLRDPATKLRHVLNEPHPDCGWVIAGEGTPTYKWDGTAIKLDLEAGAWRILARREVKPGRPTPDGFEEETHDQVTGKRVGWVPADLDDHGSRWLAQALAAQPFTDLRPGTYELVGPKVQGNPHGFDSHRLIPHGADHLADVPTGFDDLGRWLHAVRSGSVTVENQDGDPLPGGFEGVVWHHQDGRMAKVKARDWPATGVPAPTATAAAGGA